MASNEGTDKTAAPTAAEADPKGIAGADSAQRRGAGPRLRPQNAGEFPAGPATTEGSEEITERQKFQINCFRNARYHEDRERFFARWHKTTMFIVVAAGAASFASIEAKYWILPAIITLSGLVDLVFDVSGKARLHAALRRRIYEILAQAEDERSDLVKLREQAIAIYADEPPCMHAANKLAYNEAMATFGRPLRYQFKLLNRHRFLRNVWPFAGTEFKTFEELGEAPTG